MNNKKSNQNNLAPKSENQSALLAVIGAAISTLGDAISTIAAGLALEEQQNNSNDIERLQKQIDELSNGIRQIKKDDALMFNLS
ncbi:hypothetical protein [Lysinibacillus xylanilyticus]|uniref:hypothetical protein n=1 Tax=Lysinibacillus xylanilyticus TaxID=582475 RepID=UPI003D0459BB